MKTRNFTTSERLSLDRLKHARGGRGHRTSSGKTGMKRDVKQEQVEEETIPVKDLIANLLVTEKDTTGADFERAFVKHSAARFAEWIEKELGK